jgi:hypothetical protein
VVKISAVHIQHKNTLRKGVEQNNRNVMPKAFDRCVNRGGRVRTVKPKGKSSSIYVRVCYPKRGGPSVSGGVKKRKTKSKPKKKKR